MIIATNSSPLINQNSQLRLECRMDNCVIDVSNRSNKANTVSACVLLDILSSLLSLAMSNK